MTKWYGKFYNNEDKADVVFVVGSQQTEIVGHTFILSAASEVFDTHFKGDWKDVRRVVIDDIGESVFRTMLQFIYSGVVELDVKNMFNVLTVSHRYNFVVRC